MTAVPKVVEVVPEVQAPPVAEDFTRWANAHLTLGHFLEGYAVHGHIQSGVDDGGLWVHLATQDRGITAEVLELHALLDNREARMMRNTWGSVDIRWDGEYDGHRITLITYARDAAAKELSATFPGLQSDFLPVELVDLARFVQDGEGE